MLKTPKVIYSQWLEKQRRILRKYLLLKEEAFETADISSAVLVSPVYHKLQHLRNRLGGALVVDSGYSLVKSEGVCGMLSSAKNLVALMLSILEKYAHNIPYMIEAGWGRLWALCACVLTAGNKVRSWMTGKEEWSGMTWDDSFGSAKDAELRSEILAFARMTGKKEWSWMTGNKSNVILSPLWASGSIVRRSMVRIVKVACGSKDSDGAFAFSAQPLRMTGNKGLVKVVICNGGVIC